MSSSELLLAALLAVAAPGPDPCALRPEFSQDSLRARTSESCRHEVAELAAVIEQGLAGVRRLPFDAMTWLVVEPLRP